MPVHYPLGVILYQMLSSKLPYQATETYELLAAKSFDPPTPLSQYVPSLPPDISALTMAMLNHEPAHRPTMVDVELAVRRALGLPPPPRPASEPDAEGEPSAARPRTLSLPDQGVNTGAITADAPAGAELAAPAPGGSGEQVTSGPAARTHSAEPLAPPALPAAPVAAPPLLRASPEARTADGSPAPLGPAAVAAPLASTAARAQRRFPYLLLILGAAAAMAGAAAWVGLRDWHPKRSAAVADLGTPADLASPAPRVDLAAPLDLLPAEDPAAKEAGIHPHKEKDRGHRKGAHAVKGGEVDDAAISVELAISGASPQQEGPIRACCMQNLTALAGVPHSYKIQLERAGTLHIIEAPQAVRQTDLALCLRQAFLKLPAPEAVTVQVRAGK